MSSRRVVVFVAVFLVATVLHWFLGGPLAQWWGIDAATYYVAAMIVALAAALVTPSGERGKLSETDRLGFPREGEFLCDSCRYNNERDCKRPERPNATSCPDYRGR